MKIAIYSLTRDRLQYTKDCFASLRENAGMPFDHYVFDNGSTDGTQEWLMSELDERRLFAVCRFGTNQGISFGSNYCVDAIFDPPRAHPFSFFDRGASKPDRYDLICKFDNDCYIRTPNILPQIRAVAAEAGDNWILSPRVEGINKQPKRVRTVDIGGHPIGETGIVGGLFHIVPASVYRRYMDAGGYPEDLPLAKYQDDRFCHWWRKQGGRCGYIEDLVVEHYEGTDAQAKRFPEYFSRKWAEEKGEIFPGGEKK